MTNAADPNSFLKEPSLTATAVPSRMASAIVMPSSSHLKCSKAHHCDSGRESINSKRDVGIVSVQITLSLDQPVHRIREGFLWIIVAR